MKNNIRDCETVACEKCGNEFFNELFILKNGSQLLAGENPSHSLVPFEVYACSNCNHINKGFNPFEEDNESIGVD